MPKQAKNLLLDGPAVDRAESYCRRHDVSLSRLVNDFLLALPGPYDSEAMKSPIVERLKTASYSGMFAGDTYRDYISKKGKYFTKRFEDDAYLED